MTAIPVEFAQGDPTADPDNAWPVSDSGEREYLHAVATVTASGDTDVVIPTSGKKLKIRWIYAISDPTSGNSPLIKVKIGSTEKFRVYALSKRQLMIGGTDEKLTINLSSGGSVAVTVIYEEIT